MILKEGTKGGGEIGIEVSLVGETGVEEF